MRRAVLALAAVFALAACQQPADAPAAEVASEPAPAAVMPADAPPQEEVDDDLAAAPTGDTGSCLAEIGVEASDRLVRRCIAVSPATHPPCNAANPCAMVQGEIDRACAMYDASGTRPAECGA